MSGLDAAMTAVTHAITWGYGAGVGFVLLVVLLRQPRGGE